MPKQPEGNLTGPQFEILRILWDAQTALTVAEIWEAIGQTRQVSRTTVLNLVDRLEKRNWLKRSRIENVFRYEPAVDRQTTEKTLASEFVGEYFDGSPSNFLLSLMGSKRVSRDEIARLKQMLNDAESKSKSSSPKTTRNKRTSS
ncbi:MAG: BlaI/MecI/CopY family transcriptional regulator [Pirellulaceae bacterium]